MNEPIYLGDQVEAAYHHIRAARILERTGLWTDGAQARVRHEVVKALRHAALSANHRAIDDAIWLALTTVEVRDSGPLDALHDCRAALVRLGIEIEALVLADVAIAFHEHLTLSIDDSTAAAVAYQHKIFELCDGALSAAAEQRIEPELGARALYGQVLVTHEHWDAIGRMTIGEQRLRLALWAEDPELTYHALRHLIPVYFMNGRSVLAEDALALLRRLTHIHRFHPAEFTLLSVALKLAWADPRAVDQLEHLHTLSIDSEAHIAQWYLQTWWQEILRADREADIVSIDQHNVVEIAIEVTKANPEAHVTYRSMGAFSSARRGRGVDATTREHLDFVYTHRARLPSLFGGIAAAAGCIEAAYRIHEPEMAVGFASVIDPRFAGSLLQVANGGFILGAADRFFAVAAAANGGVWAGKTAGQHLDQARHAEGAEGTRPLVGLLALTESVARLIEGEP